MEKPFCGKVLGASAIVKSSKIIRRFAHLRAQEYCSDLLVCARSCTGLPRFAKQRGRLAPSPVQRGGGTTFFSFRDGLRRPGNRCGGGPAYPKSAPSGMFPGQTASSAPAWPRDEPGLRRKNGCRGRRRTWTRARKPALRAARKSAAWCSRSCGQRFRQSVQVRGH